VKIKSERDFFAGLLFMVAGVAFAWGASGFQIGSAVRMGPGYFPLLLGIVLTALGALILFGSLVVEREDGERIGNWAWKPLGFMVAANAVVIVLLKLQPSLWP